MRSGCFQTNYNKKLRLFSQPFLYKKYFPRGGTNPNTEDDNYYYVIPDKFLPLRSWFRSLRSIWRNQGTTLNAQQGPSENDNSGEIGGRNGTDSSSDSEREHVYDTLGDGMENIDSPQIQIQPQGDRSNVRNRRQGVPPVYVQSQPAEKGDESHTPLEAAATTLHKETNQESNPNRNDGDDDNDVAPQPVTEGDKSLPPLGTVPITDYEETNQESNLNRKDAAAVAAAADNDDDDDWNEERCDGKVDETVYINGQSTSPEATPLTENTKIDENTSAERFIVADDDKGAGGGNNDDDNDGDDWNEDHGDGKVEVTSYSEGPIETVPVTENISINIDIHENTSREQSIVVDDGEGAGDSHNDDDDHGYDGQVGQIIYGQDQSTSTYAAPFIEDSNINSNIHENTSEEQ